MSSLLSPRPVLTQPVRVRVAYVGTVSGPRIIRTPAELGAYLAGRPALDYASVAIMARVDAALRMAVTGR